MKRFLYRVISFCALFFVFDKAFILVREHSPETQVDRRLERIINGRMNKDIVVFGSSRGARDIIAGQMDDSLNLTCYNLSYPGSNILFHEFLLEKLIRHNKKPQAVILVLDDRAELLEDESIKFRFDRLYPLVKYPEIRKELIKRGEQNAVLSKLFILHQLNKANFRFHKKGVTPLDTMLECGSMPISTHLKNKRWIYKANSGYDVNLEVKAKLTAFLNFQDICISNNINLIFVFPPNFKVLNKDFYNRIAELARPEVKLFGRVLDDPGYRDKKFFHGKAHLNTAGAEIFTNEMTKFLSKEVFSSTD